MRLKCKQKHWQNKHNQTKLFLHITWLWLLAKICGTSESDAIYC